MKWNAHPLDVIASPTHRTALATSRRAHRTSIDLNAHAGNTISILFARLAQIRADQLPV